MGGAYLGHHLGQRLGRGIATQAQHGLDAVDPKGASKEASSIQQLAAKMVKTADPLHAFAPGIGGLAGSYLLGGQIPGGMLVGGLGGSALGGALGGLSEAGLEGAGAGALGGLRGGAKGALAGGALGSLTTDPRMAVVGADLGGVLGAYSGYEHEMNKLKERKALEAAAAPDEGKLAYARNLWALGLRKQAEDAINPAQISAGTRNDIGPNPPEGASAAGEEVPAEPSDVNSQKRLIDSNEAAISYKRREAKSDPKGDLAHILNEPALSAEHDSTLRQAFEHTDEAGAKIAQRLERVAASRAILNKLAQQQKAASGCAAPPAKKTKKAMMGGAGSAPTTPQAASGFSAGAQS